MHPIFDGVTFKWSDKNVQELHKLLATLAKYKRPDEAELRYERAGNDLPAATQTCISVARAKFTRSGKGKS